MDSKGGDGAGGLPPIFLPRGNRRMALLLVLKLLVFNLLMVEEISSICTTLDLFFMNQDLF